jgi:hypothetical protein
MRMSWSVCRCISGSMGVSVGMSVCMGMRVRMRMSWSVCRCRS